VLNNINPLVFIVDRYCVLSGRNLSFVLTQIETM